MFNKLTHPKKEICLFTQPNPKTLLSNQFYGDNVQNRHDTVNLKNSNSFLRKFYQPKKQNVSPTSNYVG